MITKSLKSNSQENETMKNADGTCDKFITVSEKMQFNELKKKRSNQFAQSLPSESSVTDTCGTFASVAELLLLVPAIGSLWAAVGVADVLLLVSLAEPVSRGDCDGIVDTLRPDSSNCVKSIRVSSMPSDARDSANVKRAAGCWCAWCYWK